MSIGQGPPRLAMAESRCFGSWIQTTTRRAAEVVVEEGLDARVQLAILRMTGNARKPIQPGG
jgi:hypothetical protein